MDKIAYLILTHDDPVHLKRLINSLDYYADFYIHVDLKVDLHAFRKLFIGRENIHFTSNRFPVYWGGINIIEATKSLITASLSTYYKRVVLLSGSDYPLVSSKNIHNFFEDNREIEFIRGFNVSKSGSTHYLNQIVNCHYMMDKSGSFFNKIIRRGLRYTIGKLPLKSPYIKTKEGEWDVFFGSQWWALTHPCVKELSDIISKNNELDSYFKHSFAPDEKYFHTVFFNSSFRNNNVDGGAGLFETIGTFLWANIHHIHPTLSKWFTIDDLDEVLSSKKLFIRKVNTKFSEELINRIDIKIYEEALEAII